MPKAYWITRADVTDAAAYKLYAEAAGPAIAKHGGVYLARGGAYECVEGESRSRNVVIVFSDMESAKACYNSHEYQAARANRVNAALFDCVLVEGVE
jgi:uncharacterized protein (DUF1330 family)